MADIRISLPPGKAVFPRLKTPDTKFDDNGIYKADVAVEKAEAQPIINKLVKIYKEHVGKAPKLSDNPMFYDETDEEGVETGRVVFKCRVKNRLKKNGELWDRRPKQFDASLKPVDVNPWGGSVIVVSADIYQWNAGGKKGVSLQPVGVQILELVSGDGASPDAMGFKAQEGFVGEAGVMDEADDIDDDEIDAVEDADADY